MGGPGAERMSERSRTGLALVISQLPESESSRRARVAPTAWQA